MVPGLRLVINKLFTWPLTLLAETGNKEVNLEICKGIRRGAQRGRRCLRHDVWSAQNVLLKSYVSPKGDLLGSICRN